MIIGALALVMVTGSLVLGAPASPVLTTVFPAGGQAGSTVQVTVGGSNLNPVSTLRCSLPGARVEPGTAANQFRIELPPEALPGQYELLAVTPRGISTPRTFVVGAVPEVLEVESKDAPLVPQAVPLDVVVNGQIERGDIDQFAFTARRGQQVLLECDAERIDSRLRCNLEVCDANGKRLGANRGWFGVDPLIDFQVPADGTYIVKLSDLVFSGSPEHFYRLSISTRPRVAFTVPSVVERGKSTPVTLYGWNLKADQTGAAAASRENGQSLQTVNVEISAPVENRLETLRLKSSQVGVDGFAYLYPGADVPVLISSTDVPVVGEPAGNHSATTAYEVAVPSEVAGQLREGDEQDWFAVTARRGEVIWIEAFGERIGAPVDLDFSVFDPTGAKELASFHDGIPAHQAQQFPASHLDPAGRWVAPTDGRYLILVRNLLGSLDADARRQYRLRLRREEPDMQVVAVPWQRDPAASNVGRGGTCVLEILAFRERGLTGEIRVAAKNLPPGITCPEVWLGPGVDSAPLVVNVAAQAAPLVGSLELEAFSEATGARTVRGGAMIHKGVTGVTSRLTQGVPFAVAGDVPLRITADGHAPKKHVLYGEMKVRHSPGCILDVEVAIERTELNYEAPVRLSGIGLPDGIENQTVTVPAGQHRATLSFYLPPALPVGQYSLAVQAETTVPVGAPDASGKYRTETAVVASNSVSFEVQPAAFVVTADPFAPRRIKRGEIIQVAYSARRINGFIGKIHTELDAPGEIIGLRGRGVTFTGQTDTGSIQIIASDDAPLGAQPFLRLYGVGVVEDQAVFHGSCFLNIEIVE